MGVSAPPLTIALWTHPPHQPPVQYSISLQHIALKFTMTPFHIADITMFFYFQYSHFLLFVSFFVSLSPISRYYSIGLTESLIWHSIDPNLCV